MESSTHLVLLIFCFWTCLQSTDGGACFRFRCSYKGIPGCKNLKSTEDDANDCCLSEGATYGHYRKTEALGKGCYKCHTCTDILSTVDGGWSDWTDWSDCTEECGGGWQFQTRSCNNPVPSALGKPCDGDDRIQKQCNMHNCPVHGGWTSWSPWTDCSKKCNEGIQERTRSCTNPAPQYNGRPCPGSRRETKTCLIKMCPINGGWGAWTPWSPCSETCDEGLKNRHRACDNPRADYGGKGCSGPREEMEVCMIEPCPVDGNWSPWSPESKCIFPDCTKKSDGGFRVQTRACNNPAPAHGGKMCKGNMFKKTYCVTPDNCIVDGAFTPWSDLTCPACGVTERTRQCNNPPPQNGGKKCEGEKEETVLYDSDDPEYCKVCPNLCRCVDNGEPVAPLEPEGPEGPEGSGGSGSGSGFGENDQEN